MSSNARTSAATAAPDTGSAPPRRRQLLAGLGLAGAAGVAATALPLVRNAAPAAAAPVALAPEPEAGGGYQLSAHVQRYYQTARV